MTEERKKRIVIYHAGCIDGFCAAFIAWQAYCTDCEYFPAQYGSEPPDVEGRHVYILDFSYPREVLERMHAEAASLVVLDHHRTAQADLEGLEYAEFDMDRSGAGMSWDYFYEGRPRPWYVDYIEDRDLWTWKLENSKAINESIRQLEFEFEDWEELFCDKSRSEHESTKIRMVREGELLLKQTQRLVDIICGKAIYIEYEDMMIPVVSNGCLISEAVGELAEDHQFAIGWFQLSENEFVYNLRSRGDFDVSAVAKKFGGGGHKNAAGFKSDKIPTEWAKSL